MASKQETYLVKIKDNDHFCGIGAGGTQFANGQAVISDLRMARWFMEHKGYEVVKQGGETPPAEK